MTQPNEVYALLAQAGGEVVYDDPVIEAYKHEWEDLYQLARFCLLLGVPLSEAKQMREIERRAFVEAHNDIQHESKRKG